MVLALAATSRFARRLDGRQQKGDQHADNGDYDEQFNQRKGLSARDAGASRREL
jgi:hypothetical protein